MIMVPGNPVIAGLLALALLPPLYLMIRIYREDKVEREPVGLIVKLIIFGVICTIPAAFIEGIVISALGSVLNPYSMAYLVVENFLCIALVEELCKYGATRLGSWNSRDFNYKFDGIVYAAAAALGFAACENVLYVFQYGAATGVLRAVTAIPGHCIFGIFMGINYSMAKHYAVRGEMAKARHYKRMAIIHPTILHGIYDLIASLNSYGLFFVFVVYIIVLDVVAIKRVKAAEASDAPL